MAKSRLLGAWRRATRLAASMNGVRIERGWCVVAGPQRRRPGVDTAASVSAPSSARSGTSARSRRTSSRSRASPRPTTALRSARRSGQRFHRASGSEGRAKPERRRSAAAGPRPEKTLLYQAVRPRPPHAGPAPARPRARRRPRVGRRLTAPDSPFANSAARASPEASGPAEPSSQLSSRSSPGRRCAAAAHTSSQTGRCCCRTTTTASEA